MRSHLVAATSSVAFVLCGVVSSAEDIPPVPIVNVKREFQESFVEMSNEEHPVDVLIRHLKTEKISFFVRGKVCKDGPYPKEGLEFPLRITLPEFIDLGNRLKWFSVEEKEGAAKGAWFLVIKHPSKDKAGP